jgi:thymidylate kinase
MTIGTPPVFHGAVTAVPTLRALTDLFDRLHAEGVRYCHWKSNEHLPASMAGVTDIDILVDRQATQTLARVLAETSFKQFTTVSWCRYQAIESYLGFDADSGTLLHLHVHYQLTVGERYLKGYRLPWEELLLNTRQWDDASGIYVADPHLELVIFTVRVALKLRVRDRVLDALGRQYIRGGSLREFRWLAARSVSDRLREMAASLVGARAIEILVAMISGGTPTVRQLMAFRRAIQPPLTNYRTYGGFEAQLRSWAREWGWRLARFARRRGFLVPTRRLLPQGGLLVAVVGADGSGKSTVTRAIADWLATNMDSALVYLGNGKGTISFPRRLLELGAELVRRATEARDRAPVGASGVPRRPQRGAGRSLVRDWGDLLWILSLTRERHKRFQRARRARNLGMVVVCDRFPQTQFPGLNDGPWLSHWLRHASPVRRAVARRELDAIQLAERHAPDLVVKLHVPLHIAQARRANTPIEQLSQKAQEIRALQFPGAGRTVDIDASQPLEQVLLDVKRALWACL